MIRRVASADGSRYYGLPIGAPIGAALKNRISRVKGPEPKGASVAEPQNGSEATDLKTGYPGHHTPTTALQAVAQGRSDLLRVPHGFTVSGVSKDSAHADVFAADADGNFYAMMPNSGSIVKIEPVSNGPSIIANPRKGQTVTWTDDNGFHAGRVGYKGSKQKKPYYTMESSTGEYITTIWPEGKPPVGTSANALPEQPGVVTQVYSPKVTSGTAPNGMRKVKITAATDPGAADGHLEYNGQSWMGRISADLAPDYSQRVPPNGYPVPRPGGYEDEGTNAPPYKSTPDTSVLGDSIADIADAGIKRFGSADAFQKAMAARKTDPKPSAPTPLKEGVQGSYPTDPEDVGGEIDVMGWDPDLVGGLSDAEVEYSIKYAENRRNYWGTRQNSPAEREAYTAYDLSLQDLLDERDRRKWEGGEQGSYPTDPEDVLGEIDAMEWGSPEDLSNNRLKYAIKYAKDRMAYWDKRQKESLDASEAYQSYRSAYRELITEEDRRWRARQGRGPRRQVPLGPSAVSMSDEDQTAMYLSRMESGEFLR